MAGGHVWPEGACMAGGMRDGEGGVHGVVNTTGYSQLAVKNRGISGLTKGLMSSKTF